MGTPSKQIGWSTEANLLHAILRQLDQLAGVIAVSGGGGLGNFVTLDTVQPIVARKDFTVVAGPAATFTSSTGNTVNVTATTGSGVYSTSVDGPGVEAFSVNDPGIFGYSSNEPGVFSHSQNSVGFIVDSLNVGNLSDLAHFRANGIPVFKIAKTGKLLLSASTTAASLMNLPVGVAPAAPIDGDVWLEANTLTGLKIRLGGVTRTITIT